MRLLLWYGVVWDGMVWYGMVCYANNMKFSWLWKPVCLLWLAALSGGLSGWLAVCLLWLATWLAALSGCLFVSRRRFQQPTKSNDLQTVPVA